MKRFRFSLDTLLALRREQEQECEIALAAASGELLTLDGRIAEARRAGEHAFESPAPGLDEMAARDRLWTKSVNDRAALAAPRAEAARKTDEARRLYTRAHIERKALERLREKRFEQWRGAVKREETRYLDESAKGAVRRRHESGSDSE